MNAHHRAGNRIVDVLAYVYVVLPVVIFIVGWIRWYIAVPAALLIAVSFYLSVKAEDSALPSVSGRDLRIIALAAILILGWVFLSGIGGFVFQNADHPYRNKIFKLLVEKSWPVTQESMDPAGSSRFLCYYIGFWMPAAAFGKVFGLGAGYVFQYAWAALGVFLVYLKMSEYLGRWSVLALLVFIFFSGLDAIGCSITRGTAPVLNMTAHLEWWSRRFQFSSHTTQLFWVFNQAIYGWLITLLILNAKRRSSLVFVFSCGLLECTFPFVGMLPLLLYKVFASGDSKQAVPVWKNPGAFIRELFSFSNVVGGGLIGIITAVYLFGNTSVGHSGVVSEGFSKRDILRMAVFLFLEAGVYYIAIFRSQKKNPLFYITLFTLLLCPLIRVGYAADFCMRASIPSLLILCLLVIDSLREARTNSKVAFYALLIVFFIGCVTPIHEGLRTGLSTISMYRKGQEMISYTPEDILTGSNFSSDTDGNLFYKYLAK